MPKLNLPQVATLTRTKLLPPSVATPTPANKLASVQNQCRQQLFYRFDFFTILRYIPTLNQSKLDVNPVSFQMLTILMSPKLDPKKVEVQASRVSRRNPTLRRSKEPKEPKANVEALRIETGHIFNNFISYHFISFFQQYNMTGLTWIFTMFLVCEKCWRNNFGTYH